MKKQHKYWYRYRKKSRLGSIGIGIENTRLVWYRLGLGLDAIIMVPLCPSAIASVSASASVMQVHVRVRVIQAKSVEAALVLNVFSIPIPILPSLDFFRYRYQYLCCFLFQRCPNTSSTCISSFMPIGQGVLELQDENQT